MTGSSKIKKIIIDESIPENQAENIVSLLKRGRIDCSDFCFISKEHKGMPDYQIIHFLLNDATVLFTCDRPFHNTVLKKGYKSFYYNGEVFSPELLKGISPIKMPAQIRKDLSPQDSYHETGSEIRNLVLPKSEKGLKRLRTKRRRIKSYFGGTENMGLVAITVSCMPLDSSMLVGIRIKISSNTGIEALDASESYISEKADPGNSEIIAIFHGLIASVQLMLNNVKTILYYDAQRLHDPAGVIQKNPDHPSYFILQKLLEMFPRIEFTPSSKGKFIESLRRKLDDLSLGKSNEIVTGRFFEIDSDMKQFYAEHSSE